jgi:SAM-dependent methyltransferase
MFFEKGKNLTMTAPDTATAQQVHSLARVDAETAFQIAEHAILKHLPFKEYPNSMRGNREIARILMRHLPRGSAVLDYGSGACTRAAFMALCGYRVWACDDLCDFWHLQDQNRERIFQFAKEMDIEFFLMESQHELPYRAAQFDLVMINDVLEHLHDSPIELLCRLIEFTKPGGLVLVTVPNAANLRKRVGLLVGRTNYPPFEEYFWYPSPWRGHVREYVLDDLSHLSSYVGLETIELRDFHLWVDFKLRNALARCLYLGVTALIPSRGVRDSLLLLGQKPPGWNRELVERARPVSPKWAR